MKAWARLELAVLLVGVAAIVTGVAKIHPPAAWIVGGLACIALIVLPTRRS